MDLFYLIAGIDMSTAEHRPPKHATSSVNRSVYIGHPKGEDVSSDRVQNSITFSFNPGSEGVRAIRPRSSGSSRYARISYSFLTPQRRNHLMLGSLQNKTIHWRRWFDLTPQRRVVATYHNNNITCSWLYFVNLSTGRRLQCVTRTALLRHTLSTATRRILAAFLL